ncbi:MAG: alpha/beta fold hydrolase, partial [Pseudomonadota bacterium]
MTQTFTASDGTRLAYRDEGNGLPVLCLSGLTRNGSDFDYVAPHLSDLRLIRLDYRGRGASDWADPATYTIPTEAADALSLLDHLGIEKAAILGTSRGGMIAMMLAATAKDRLLGVCLNDVGPELDATGLDVIKGYIGRNPVAKSLPDLAMARARMLNGFANVPDQRWMEEAEKHYIVTGAGITINYDPDLARIFDEPATAVPDLWP